MGRSYFCDFCEKSFGDTPSARKKHLNSIQHQRLRKLHYDSFKDSITLLKDEAARNPCKRFFQTGQCHFGENCIYSHVSRQTIQAAINSAESQESTSIAGENFDVAAWEAKWRNKSKTASSIPKKKESWVNLPSGFPPVHLLPPSLQPPPANYDSTGTANQWG